MTAFEPMLTEDERAFASAARRGVLATVRPSGLPRLVPICFALAEDVDEDGRVVLYTPLDEKPKSQPDPRALARVEDIASTPSVEVLVDRWSEDWSELGWIRLTGTAALIEPEVGTIDEHRSAVVALREKYPQYEAQAIESRPVIRIAVTRVSRWGDLRLAGIETGAVAARAAQGPQRDARGADV